MIYSTDFYPSPERVSGRTVLSWDSHSIKISDERIAVSWWQPGLVNPLIDPFYGRIVAAWWAHHPEAVTDDEVTVSLGGNFTIHVPDLEQRCTEELGDDDVILIRHPWRDCIYTEAEAAKIDWRWSPDYSGQDMAGQVASYREAGHPEHWGLFHGGMVVRRASTAMRAFDAAWWAEYCRWSSQDQLSLPYLLRRSGIRWHTYDPFAAGWVSWGVLGVAA